MALCQLVPDLFDSNTNGEDSGLAVDWTVSSANFSGPQEAVGFISQNRSEQTAAIVDHTQISYNPALLKVTRRQYTTLCSLTLKQSYRANHLNHSAYLLQVVLQAQVSPTLSAVSKLYLDMACCVAAPTGVAAFSIGGQTMHSLLRLALNFNDCNDCKDPALQDLQVKLAKCST